MIIVSVRKKNRGVLRREFCIEIGFIIVQMKNVRTGTPEFVVREVSNFITFCITWDKRD